MKTAGEYASVAEYMLARAEDVDENKTALRQTMLAEAQVYATLSVASAIADRLPDNS